MRQDTKISAVIIALTWIFPASVLAENCGPFGMFSGSDYCASCYISSQNKTVDYQDHNCPGGEGGKAAVFQRHPGCTIVFGQCGSGHSQLLLNATKGTTVAGQKPTSPVTDDTLSIDKDTARAGHAVVTSWQDGNVVIEMKEEDFQKLLKLKDPSTK